MSDDSVRMDSSIPEKYLDITIDFSRDKLFDEYGLKRLRESYMREDEHSPQQRYALVAKSFGSNLEHSQRLYDYASDHWLSFSTPILSFGRSKRGLPISCFLNYMKDDSSGLVDTLSETNWLSMLGGGVGTHVQIRSADDKSVGVMPHLKIYDASSLAYRQGKCYLPGTKVFTDKGFIDFREVNKNIHKIGMVDENKNIIFTNNYELIEEDHNGKIVNFKSKNFDIHVTPNHRMISSNMRWVNKNKRNFDGHLNVKSAKDFYPQKDSTIMHVTAKTSNRIGSSTLSPHEKFLVAHQADGHIINNITGEISGCHAVEFHFSKDRKIAALQEILNDCKYEYTTSKQATGTTKIYVKVPVEENISKRFDWINLNTRTRSWSINFLLELSKWDSHIKKSTQSFTYATIEEYNAKVIQSMAVMAGYFNRLDKLKRSAPKKDIYTVFISINHKGMVYGDVERHEYDYTGKVYCAVVPTGMLLVEYNGQPLVCGNTRRGSYAMYLDISHPDIIQFLEIRKPTGDQNIRCLNLHHGINITDDFMQIIERCMEDPDADDSWNLFDPNNPEKIVATVSAKDLWQRIIEIRMQTGEPYLHFIDTANRALPEWQKKSGLKIYGSNLCSEIELCTSAERTAVCCLSSLNLEYYNDWKDNEIFIHDVAEMLDNVLQYFIENAPDEIHRARYSAMRERSIGVGVLGFHSYLQQNMIPFDSLDTKILNIEIFNNIRYKLNLANWALAKSRGEAPDAIGYGVRFSHMMAIAPTASSSIIMGNTSPSIEPMRANAYRQDTLSGSFLNKNKFLDRIIKSKCEDEEDYNKIWSDIISNDGSVQHLKILSEEEKSVFKTAMEIDQRWIIELAADRAPLIDQGQSVNVFFRPDSNLKYIHTIHFLAWQKGLKALYYCRSDKLRKADKISQKIEREIIKELDKPLITEDECLACSA